MLESCVYSVYFQGTGPWQQVLGGTTVDAMTMQWLSNIDCWHWWVLAGAFLILELLSPKFFFLWLGIIAVAVGFLVFAFPSIPFALQVAAFGVAGVVATVAWYRYRES